MRKTLIFVVRGTIPGTNLFAEQKFKADVTLTNIDSITIAISCALSRWVDEVTLGVMREQLIAKMQFVKSLKAIEILTGQIAENKGSYRILAKNTQ